MQKVAIITGASSGIGRCISNRLISKGYKVYGIGRNFEKLSEDNSYSIDNEDNSNIINKETSSLFCPIVCDIMDTNKLVSTIKNILKENEVSVLINNAGVAYYGLHEELNPQKIIQMVRTNLEAPMIITQLALRHLKKNEGYIINISSVTASRSNPHGCAYGATKAGLSSFSHSLFDEARKYGVKVVSVNPDMTDTNLYRNADFKAAEEYDAHLDADDVADAVEFILDRRDGIVVTDMTIQPKKHRISKKINI